ncbi:lantibiotic dehydratase [Streptomyces sp. H39-S7]|uniref:lantibiotic dehydratase n=1 Tax=Streptomyces sp. H39-S7 TaxID=3004357 RepID=UPI0022AEF99E|nr:lantibiotic dehydratase [Streptomyces sp. H39-S7]MCZ4123541.1 lantibiotic dehydratase [Streptomyces sp. H39-S7]
MKSAQRMPYYRQTGTAMLRASVHTEQAGLMPWPGLYPDGGDAQWVGWLTAAWANRPVAEAVAIASPVLAGQIDAALAGQPTEAGQVRRMALALARYLARMRGRATPFGAFAGVSTARFGPRTSVLWTEAHQTRAQADAVWLAHVIARLEACTELQRRLPVQINDLAVVRGERLVVSWSPHATSDHPPGEVSVRHVPVVQMIRKLATSPIRAGALVAKVAAEYPGASAQALEVLVGELITQGVLISSLRPPSTATDALAYLLGRLDEADAANLPQTQALDGELHAIHTLLRATDRSEPWPQWRGRRETSARMRAISDVVDQPLIADLRLGATVVLPPAVAREAAEAASALIRLSPAPAGNASWREYHGRFLGRYGPGTLVAVEQLVDPTTGLGVPRHFAHPGDRELSLRDEALLTVAQQAALDGAGEVVLNENRLQALAAGGIQRPVSPVDLWVDVRATTTAALDSGDFTLGLRGFGRLAANTGRFLALLDEPERQQVSDLYAELPTGVAGALAAQLSFPPQEVRQENILRVPPVLADMITLAEHREPVAGRITVRDLAIVADQHRLYVVSLSRRRVVEPMLPHTGARHTMPPLARLLFEIPRSAHPQVMSFDWGVASGLPFLPRLRCGRSILAPAQWRLNPADLSGPTAPRREWATALDAIREQRRLPTSIVVGSGDRQLRLNLDEAMDRDLLRAHLDAASGPVTLTEAPTAADHGWFGGRAHEIVIPLAATAPPAPAPAFLTGSAPLPLAARHPEKGVVYVKLYGRPEVFDTLLTDHVPALLARWVTPPQWWFVRYRHPAPHLRIRLHDADCARAVGRVAAWANGLRQLGLIGEITFDTYHPEIGRYGTGAAMAAAEALFAADSAAICTQLAALSVPGDLHPQALTAASLADLAVAMTGSRSAGLRWLIDHSQLAGGGPMQDRDMRRQTLLIAGGQVLDELRGGQQIVAAWAARAQAAARYAACLTPATTRVTPGSVLTSLLHLHHIRAHGTDADAEAMTHKLARAIALAWASGQGTDQEEINR